MLKKSVGRALVCPRGTLFRAGPWKTAVQVEVSAPNEHPSCIQFTIATKGEREDEELRRLVVESC